MAVTFSYPVTSPTSTLTLKSPELGDTYSLDTGVENRVNRGNETLVAYDSDWVKTRIKTLSFVGNSDAKKTELETFLSTVQGLQIKYVDQNNYIWHCYIIDSAVELVNQYRECGWRFTLQITGERQ